MAQIAISVLLTMEHRYVEFSSTLSTGDYKFRQSPENEVKLAVWEAYIDESGDESSDQVFVLAGYLFRSSEAIHAREKWGRALRRVNVPYFHMVDCAHGNGLYRNIDKQKREWLARRCIDIIKDHAEIGIAFVINSAKWFPSQGNKEFDNAYGQTAMHIFTYFASFIKALDTDPVFHITFESGHSTQSLARNAIYNGIFLDKIFPNEKEPIINFKGKEEDILLQCADLVAWQTAKYVKDAIKGKNNPRADFKSLVELDHDLYFFYLNNNIINTYRDRSLRANEEFLIRFIRSLYGKSEDSAVILHEIEKMFPIHKRTNENLEELLSGERFYK
jgi:hypothetical protein